MTKIWFSFCKNSDGSFGWKTASYPHKGSIAIDSSQRIHKQCPNCTNQRPHLSEIKGIKTTIECRTCCNNKSIPIYNIPLKLIEPNQNPSTIKSPTIKPSLNRAQFIEINLI